jgi:hypothetical protein
VRPDRIRDPEAAQHGLDRGAPRIEGGRDQRDLLGCGAPANEREELLADELERAAGSCALEEADGGVELGRRRRRLLEERPLEMRERRVLVLGRPRRELLDAPGGEAREVVGRSLQ